MIRFSICAIALVLNYGCSACTTSRTPSGADDGGVSVTEGGPPADGGARPDGAGSDAGGGSDDGVTGDECSANEDCTSAPSGSALCFPSLVGWPGGYCTTEGCDPAADDCPGDGVCEMGDDGGACLDACDPAAPDCRPGYNCFDASMVLGGASRHYCLPFCTEDGDCASGERCGTSGSDPAFLCYTPGTDLGDECVDRSDCGEGQFCLAEDPFGFPAGYCTASCNPTLRGECGGGVCIGSGPPDEGLCLAGCRGDEDCRRGYACDDELSFAPRLPANACVPRCESNSDCTVSGRSCERAVGLCQPPLDPADFGGPCSSDADCVGGFCLEEIEDGAPRGYCLDECEPGGAASDCPTGGTCRSIGSAIPFGICLTSCDPMSPMCREGYVCPSFGPVTDVCIPDCSGSAQCGSSCCSTGTGGTFATGRCVDPGSTPPPTCLP